MYVSFGFDQINDYKTTLSKNETALSCSSQLGADQI